jgi:uncharacterized protein
MNASRRILVRSFVLAGLLSLCFAAMAQVAPDRRDHESRRTLTVTGNGEVSTAPDHAVVRLGATAQAEEAAAAQIEVNEIMQKALKQVEAAGIPKRFIRTTGLTLTPVYTPQRSPQQTEPKIIAYRAGNVIEVTVEDIKLVGKVIDAGLSAGANRLEGVSFRLKDDLPQRSAALTRAVEEARAKAQTMARALDVPLGAVREVVEGGVQIFRQEHFGGARAMMAADAMQTPVEPGEVRVQASVTIHYDIGEKK